MSKLNCLVYNTKLKNDILLYMKILAADAVENDMAAPFTSMYHALKKEAGFDIDMESAGYLYNEAFGNKNIDIFTPKEEVEELVGRPFKDAVSESVNAFSRTAPKITQKTTGKSNPENEIAIGLSGLFNKEVLDDVPEVVSTDIRKMQDMVGRAAAALLPKDKSTNASTLLGALNDFFEMDAKAFERLDGGINTMRDLWNQTKKELDKFVSEATKDMSEDDALIFREKWDNYFEAFKNAGYSVMLGKGKQNELLNEALKQVNIDGVQVADKNGNVNWKAFIEFGDTDVIVDKFKKLFQDGFTDNKGNTQKFTPYQAEVLGEYMRGLYERKLAAVKQQKIANERTRMQSAKNLVADFLKDQGFINLVKDKSGELLLTQANWDAFKKKILASGDKAKGIDEAVAQFSTFLDTHKDSKGDLLFTDPVKKAEAIQSFREAITAKFLPNTASANNIERLIALNNLNGGKAFQKETAVALNKLAGISQLSQKAIDKIQSLTQVAKGIVGNMVSSNVSPNGQINVGAFAFQALAQIDREIKKILREHMVDESAAQNFANAFADVLNSASSTLLMNPNNFGENPLTGFGTNLSESVKQLFTDPKLFMKQFGANQKTFWTAFLSYAMGGADTKIINELDLEVDLPAGERKRLRELGDIFRGDVSAISKLRKGFGIPITAVNVSMRLLFNSFDAGFNAAFMRKNMANSIYDALIQEGKTPKQAREIIDKNFLNLTPTQISEIEAANKQIIKSLRDAGLYPTKFDEAQNLADMKLAFYQNVIMQGAAQMPTPTQVQELAKAFVRSGQDVSRKLGGKKMIHDFVGFDIPLMLIYGGAKGLTAPQRMAFSAQQEYEREGKLGAAAASKAVGALWQNSIGRFAGGVANFLALGITSTPLGFITAKQLGEAQKRIKGVSGFEGDPDAVRKYNQAHQMVRSMVVRATMGSLAMAGTLAYYLSMDDEDEEETFLNNLMQTATGRKLIARFVPLAASSIVLTMGDVKDKKLDSKMERLMEFLSQVSGKKYDSWEGLKQGVTRAKDEDDYKTALAQYISGFFSININQDEQVTRFYHTLQSALDPSYISEVQEDEKISKDVYKSINNAQDAILINGAIDKVKRISEGQPNRYAR